LEHGKHVKFYEQMDAKGKVTPLSERPIHNLTNTWYLKVFTVLSNSRSGGMNGENPLQISEMNSYMDRFPLISTAEEFVEVMQALDMIYINHRNKDVNKPKQKTAKRK